MNEALRRLEEKIAYLERHVGEQDRMMLEQTQRLDALHEELRRLRERMAAAPDGLDAEGKEPPPPHY